MFENGFLYGTPSVAALWNTSGLSDGLPSTILTKQVENKNWKIFNDQLQKQFLAGQELRTAL